jgi:hypothetical protein
VALALALAVAGSGMALVTVPVAVLRFGSRLGLRVRGSVARLVLVEVL